MNPTRLTRLYLGLLFFTTTLALAQVRKSKIKVSPRSTDQIPACELNSMDAASTFGNEPDGEQMISVYFRNESAKACRLQGEPGPSFSVDSHSMWVKFCSFCSPDGSRLPISQARPENQIVLAPGESAAVDLRWNSSGDSCQWADWASIFFNWTGSSDFRKDSQFLFIPSAWPMHICSTVQSFGYRGVTNLPSKDEATNATLTVFPLGEPVYSDERATLHVELSGAAQPSAKQVGCASLYAVLRSEPLITRLEPLQTVGSLLVNSYSPEQIEEDKKRAWPSWKKEFRRRCDIPAGVTKAGAQISASDLAKVTRIEWSTVPAPGRASVFVTAPAHFNVLDVDSLAPNWGKSVRGIRAGLSVDRVKFKLGERVPLHLRWENVNANLPLAQGECNEPQPELEIEDSQHRVLKTLGTDPICSGHGWGPFVIAKGAPLRYFIELPTGPAPGPFALPFLPGPGVYYLSSVWSARVLDTSAVDTSRISRLHAGRMAGVYATARSLPVRIQVLPNM